MIWKPSESTHGPHPRTLGPHSITFQGLALCPEDSLADQFATQRCALTQSRPSASPEGLLSSTILSNGSPAAEATSSQAA